jgi:hypothetical protein
MVVLPIAQLNEVRNLPENQVSFMKDVIQMFAGEHTGIGIAPPETIQTIKVDLTRHIASTLDDLQEEIVYGFDKEFGKCEEWTAFPLYSKVLRVVALLSSRVFVCSCFAFPDLKLINPGWTSSQQRRRMAQRIDQLYIEM